MKNDTPTTRQRSEFDRAVRGAVAIFKEYARVRRLGPPLHIVSMSEFGSCGVAVKWDDYRTGHGIVFDRSAPNIEAAVEEIVRRLKDWQQEGATA